MRKFLFFMPILIFGFSYAEEELWNRFKQKFVKNKSYVIDPYNNNRVTSEAQGYTLLIAVLEDDKKTFKSIWKWTKENLQREDYLFSWVWNNGNILDKNNALDGDLFIAYSLLLAYKKWKKEEYLKEFKRIYKSIYKMILPVCNIKEENKDIILLPAKYGFVKNSGIFLFPSYYIPFIFKEFYNYSEDPIWKFLYNYSYKIYSLPKMSDNIFYSFFDKEIKILNTVSMDVYRIILYSFIDNPDKLSLLKGSFLTINKFFDKNTYIPLKYDYNNKYKDFSKNSSPYCVYHWFYLLYKDKRYKDKFKNLQKIDQNNYFCSALELIMINKIDGK